LEPYLDLRKLYQILDGVSRSLCNQAHLQENVQSCIEIK
jgi:hypothetical protein